MTDFCLTSGTMGLQSKAFANRRRPAKTEKVGFLHLAEETRHRIYELAIYDHDRDLVFLPRALPRNTVPETDVDVAHVHEGGVRGDSLIMPPSEYFLVYPAGTDSSQAAGQFTIGKELGHGNRERSLELGDSDMAIEASTGDDEESSGLSDGPYPVSLGCTSDSGTDDESANESATETDEPMPYEQPVVDVIYARTLPSAGQPSDDAGQGDSVEENDGNPLEENDEEWLELVNGDEYGWVPAACLALTCNDARCQFCAGYGLGCEEDETAYVDDEDERLAREDLECDEDAEHYDSEERIEEIGRATTTPAAEPSHMVPYNKHLQPGISQWTSGAMNATVVLDQGGSVTFTNLDEITGKVIVHCGKSADVSSIVVKLEGESRTRLLSPGGGPNNERPRPQLEYHKVLYKVQTVFPPAEVMEGRSHTSGKPSYTLPVGQHEYPFQFKMPFNNSCHSNRSSMPTVSMSGTGFEMARPPSHHVKKTLPPTLSGFPGEAEVRYFVKATISRHSFFKENPRAYMPFKYLPIEPPRSASTGSEVFARQKHGFSSFPENEPTKLTMKGLFGSKKEASASPAASVAPLMSVDARLPEPAILTCNQTIPLRILVKKMNEYHSLVYLQSLQISLIGNTKIRAHEVHRTESTSWVIMSESNMGVAIGTSSDPAGTEIVLDDRRWRGRPLPNTVAPSFDACNISRSYQLDIRVGLSFNGNTDTATKSQAIVLSLRLDALVYSGIAPPAELLQAMAETRESIRLTPAVEPVSEKLKMEMDTRQTSDFGSNQIPPTPVEEAGPSGPPGMPARPGSIIEQQPPVYSEAPPSYEDAIATNLQPVNVLARPDYAPPAAADDDVLRRDEKRGWGDVYAKIIEEVIEKSKDDFEETGVGQQTLTELQQEWQIKLSQRGVAQMPWDPKPAPPVVQQAANGASSLPSAASHGLPPSSYYDGHGNMNNGGSRIKSEPGTEQYYQPPQQGGIARAQQLAQEYAQSGGLQQRGGLALPGQRPQGLHLPAQSRQQGMPEHYSPQQHQMMQRQQAAMQQQQSQPRIKIENDSPQLNQGSFPQQPRQPNPAYAQTDGADEGLEEWQATLAKRRADHAELGQRADRTMRDHVMQGNSDLQSGLMVPLDEQPSRGSQNKRGRVALERSTPATTGPSVPQLDGDVDDEDEKPIIKDEDDENAINSDLDDSDDDPAGGIGDDDEDFGDNILCTYDKVQRVKNKWKCTLKDGVMSLNGKEWVFHKGMGEFEW
ncbi:hypothetical protein LTR08_006258 [Meristemomyces frigidus]|nr:hypothetical protein LTR08_006258 [Meristemomyces frigidus]